MKNTKIKFIIIFSLLLISISCSIEDIEPQNQLTEINVVIDEASADALLNSVYTPFRGSFSIGKFIAQLSTLGTDLASSFLEPDFISNNVLTDSKEILDAYIAYYKIINTANFLIEQLEAGNAVDISESRKNEMIAEARTMRALAHFSLLRSFGQFYDVNSSLGIVIRTTPARGLESATRNTVQECYDSIISDLQFGAANGRNSVVHYFVSATTAKALLAKVYLSMGDYDNAASTALAVINNTDGYALTATYAEAFNRWESPESLFAPFGGNANSEASFAGIFYVPVFSQPSQTFVAFADLQDGIMDGTPFFNSGYDPRFTFGLDLTVNGFLSHGKYPNVTIFGEDSNSYYWMRMAEVYLIFAEAEARRSGGDNNMALANLNIIRTRAGVSLKTFVDNATLLEDIRSEKRLELYNEMGEEWFDLVRYDILGDISAASLKTTLTTVDKFILPIPRAALAGNELLEQNPGY